MGNYSEWKTKYRHAEYRMSVNKKQIKPNYLTLNDKGVAEFNRIYSYCRTHYECAPATRSKGMTNAAKWKFLHRYSVMPGNQCYEMVIVCEEGIYRFIIKNRKEDADTVPGTKSCRVIYEKADEHGIDLSRYEHGTKETKEGIESPLISFLLPEKMQGVTLSDCHHLDLNSAYASMIVDEYPELRPMYEDLYSHRKENDDFYKHVLNNSIGCWQSEFCVDWRSRSKCKPYAFANLSKIAINGTRSRIHSLIFKMIDKGCLPVLTNTDGIWYKGPIYHDEDEGPGLGQWKNDHVNCRLLVRSKGAYQYEECGETHTVVRGTSNLDLVMDRKDWKFGDIMKHDMSVEKYKWTDGGIVKVWQSV